VTAFDPTPEQREILRYQLDHHATNAPGPVEFSLDPRFFRGGQKISRERRPRQQPTRAI